MFCHYVLDLNVIISIIQFFMLYSYLRRMKHFLNFSIQSKLQGKVEIVIFIATKSLTQQLLLDMVFSRKSIGEIL